MTAARKRGREGLCSVISYVRHAGNLTTLRKEHKRVHVTALDAWPHLFSACQALRAQLKGNNADERDIETRGRRGDGEGWSEAVGGGGRGEVMESGGGGGGGGR